MMNITGDFTAAVVGLGLIGGSMAKALKEYVGCKVLGYDIDEDVMQKALLTGAVDGWLDEESLGNVDFTVVVLYPGDTIKYIKDNAPYFKKGSVVIDCCGIKRTICRAVEAVSLENGFIFVGAHPMAGTEQFGFDNSFPEMFVGASLVVTPYSWTTPETLDFISDMAKRLRFGRTQISTPEKHDRLISYTSQLAHVVSCAYVGSPSAPDFRGFSAGSFQDMTRVAKLNENMWSEIFIDNKDFLTHEVDSLVQRLNEINDAIKSEDFETLRGYLREARILKEKISSN